MESRRPPYVSAAFLFGGAGLAFWGINDLVELWDAGTPDGFYADMSEKYEAYKAAHPELKRDEISKAFWSAHPDDEAIMKGLVKGNEVRILADTALGTVGSLSALVALPFFAYNGISYLAGKPRKA